MKLGVIGAGKMATALVEGVISAGTFDAGAIAVTDVVSDAAQKLAQKSGARFFKTNAELARASDAMILCVK
ncbi:MAG: NAD(P)-binding domain-containing protein, partial [Verrucomicrobiota bacterium]|nr:NAD(P)-binding domain-containing protein [Verrucomicrobiota bacterium]